MKSKNAYRKNYKRTYRRNYRNSYRNNTKKIYLIRASIIIAVLIVSFIAIKAIKHSDFLATFNQQAAPQAPDATKQPASNYSAALEQFIYTADITNTRQIGQTQQITQDNANTYCTVNYPFVGMPAIDDAIKQEAEAIVARFNSDNADYVAASPETRAYLSVDYQSYVTGDSIVSFIFDIQYTRPNSQTPVQEIVTHNYFLLTGTEIKPEELFIGNYPELFSYKTLQYIDNNPELYSDDTSDKEQYNDNTSALAENFTNFSISGSGLSLYFNPGRIAPDNFGCISFTIPTEEILPFMIYDPFIEVALPLPNTPPQDETGESGIQGIDSSKPMIALTFDDGPNKGSTERILDVLENNGVHATFFIVGNRISYNKDIVKRAYELGCDIGSHSFDHAKLTELKKNGIKKEFSRTNDILKDVIGDTAHFVRTPYGSHTKQVLNAVDYPVILWNVDTEDWKSRNKKKILKRVIGKVNDGDIILMHDIYDSTADAVEVMIPKLIEQGYQIVSISEMFEAKGIKPKNGTVYYNIK